MLLFPTPWNQSQPLQQNPLFGTYDTKCSVSGCSGETPAPNFHWHSKCSPASLHLFFPWDGQYHHDDSWQALTNIVSSMRNFSWRLRSDIGHHTPPRDRRRTAPSQCETVSHPCLINWIYFWDLPDLILFASCLWASSVSAGLQRRVPCRHLYLPCDCAARNKDNCRTN